MCFVFERFVGVLAERTVTSPLCWDPPSLGAPKELRPEILPRIALIGEPESTCPHCPAGRSTGFETPMAESSHYILKLRIRLLIVLELYSPPAIWKAFHLALTTLHLRYSVRTAPN
jgi:hypothetical protein